MNFEYLKIFRYKRQRRISQHRTNHVPEHGSYHGSFVTYAPRVFLDYDVRSSSAESRSADLQSLSRSRTFVKKDFCLAVLQFLLEYHLSVLEVIVDCSHNLYLPVFSPIILARIQVCGSRPPQLTIHHPFVEYWYVCCECHAVVLHDVTVQFLIVGALMAHHTPTETSPLCYEMFFYAALFTRLLTKHLATFFSITRTLKTYYRSTLLFC